MMELAFASVALIVLIVEAVKYFRKDNREDEED